jgi:Trypsin-like peptidase domain
MIPGMWSIEARIDGELAGSQNLQIVAAEKPAGDELSRKLLEPAEIYRRILKASVFIDKLDGDGKGRGIGSGFFLDDNKIVTAFQNIDGASKIRIRMPDGTRIETNQVLAWNRLQDWAVLPITSSAAARLPRAKTGSAMVGDRCFTLDVQAEESRLIIDESITGMNNFPLVGNRLNLSYLPTATAIGSPVVNQYGELIGLSGGTIYPGMPSRFETMNVSHFKLQQSAMATPMDLIPESSKDTSKTLDDLASMGQFVPFLLEDSNLLYGLLAPKFDTKGGGIPRSHQVKSEISIKEGTCSILLVWSPKTKSKTRVTLRLHDLANRALVMSKPTEVKLNPGSMLSRVWILPVDKLPLGVFRVDAIGSEKPFWRGYFKLID